MPHLTLVIGNKDYSSWSLRPWFFLKHHNIAFKERRIPLDTASTKAELQQYHSGLKVPILRDVDIEIWDSLAILEYISEKYSQTGGWPEDEKARAIARAVSAEMHSSFTRIRSEMPMNCRRRVEGLKLSGNALKEIERIKWIWNFCRDTYGTDGEWLFGKFTIADAMFAPIAIRFHGYCISLLDVEEQYVQSILSHSAIKEWVEAGSSEKEVLESGEVEVAQ